MRTLTNLERLAIPVSILQLLNGLDSKKDPTAKPVSYEERSDFLLDLALSLRESEHSLYIIGTVVCLTCKEKWPDHVMSVEEFMEVMKGCEDTIPKNGVIRLKDYIFSPDEREIFYKDKLLCQLNLKQWYAVYDYLVLKWIDGMKEVDEKKLINRLTEKHPSKSTKRYLRFRDWGFNTGSHSSKLYGTLIKTTGKYPNQIYLDLNYIPIAEDFPSH